MADNNPVTVLLVDDHDVVRKGLRYYLDARPEVTIVGEAGDARTAFEEAIRLVPDVVLMDLVMPLLPGGEVSDQAGIAATRQIRQASPHTQVVVLTSFSQDELLFASVKAGALSYLLKDADADTLLSTLLAAARGEPVLHPRVARRLMAEIKAPTTQEEAEKPLDALTERELEVLQLVAEGRSNADIAARLFITERTVKAHVSNLLGKLSLSDRTQAAVYAWREGLMKKDS
jgi:NarL family two-component system response regulator LiaR